MVTKEDLENLYVNCPGCGGSLIVFCGERRGIHTVLPFAISEAGLEVTELCEKRILCTKEKGHKGACVKPRSGA